MSRPIITIVCATGQHLREHQEAIHRTSMQLPVPHDSLLYTPPEPWNKLEQTRFLTHSLYQYIKADFVLTVHLDGYALHRDLWDNDFLEYDYIGAPWPVNICHGYQPPHQVGNSGFSLRSRKWLEATAQLPLPEQIEEDVWVNMKHHDLMAHKYGCKIAPVDVALAFSYENHMPEIPHWTPEMSFGFHSPWREEVIRPGSFG